MNNTVKRVALMAVFCTGFGWLGAYTFKITENRNSAEVFNQPTAYPLAVNNFEPTVNIPAVDFVDASNKSTNSVVYIKTTQLQSQNSFSFNDWFFGNGFSQNTVPVVNSGSGVIVSSDGYIVTNNHVIDKAEKIEVILNNKQGFDAKLIGTDPSSDLALLKIEGTSLPSITFFNSNMLNVGEWVLAVGNPFNLTSTVTAGIVSAKGRNLNIVNNLFPIESFIQTDAAINPGNSGGALVNTNGDLVGINTAIYTRTGAYNGYGFAIPSNIVSKVIRDLKEFGSIQRAFFGADVKDLDYKSREKLGIKSFKGVNIVKVLKDEAAEKVGIKEGDLVQQVNGVNVDTKAEFDEQISMFRPGETIKVQILRNNNPLTFNVLLTNSEGTTSVIKNKTVVNEKLGASFDLISKVERDRYNLAGGIRIFNIKQGVFKNMGLQENFIITTINKSPIKSISQLEEIILNMKGQVIIEGINPGGGTGMYSFYVY